MSRSNVGKGSLQSLNPIQTQLNGLDMILCSFAHQFGLLYLTGGIIADLSMLS